MPSVHSLQVAWGRQGSEQPEFVPHREQGACTLFWPERSLAATRDHTNRPSLPGSDPAAQTVGSVLVTLT